MKRKKTKTPDDLRAHNREYRRLRRAEKRGETEALSDVEGVVSGE